MADKKYLTFKIPVPPEVYEELLQFDMLVIPSTSVELYFAKQAIGDLEIEAFSELETDGIGYSKPLEYLRDFLNRGIYVQRPAKERLQ